MLLIRREAELLEIEGFKREVVAEMQNRAREIIEKEEAETRKKMTRMEPALLEIIGDVPDLSRQLAKGDILTLGDFADLSVEELRELGVVMPAEDAGEKIIQARKIAYDLEDDKNG